MQEFISIGIVGAALSCGIEYVQAKYGASSKEAKFYAIAGSLMAGGVYFALTQTPYYQAVLGILAAASTVYAMFFSSVKRNADAA